MNDETAERIHLRIDETHKLINDVKLSYATQKEIIDNLDENIKSFIKKVDDNLFHPEDGHITKTKTKLSSICTQVSNQWYLITLLLGGMLGIWIASSIKK